MHAPRHPFAPPGSRLLERRGLKREIVFAGALMALDWATFACAYLFFLGWRNFDATGEQTPPPESNLLPLVLCLFSIGVIFVATHRYSLRSGMRSVGSPAEHALACAIAFALVLLLQFAVFIFDLSRSRVALMAAFIVFTPVTLLFRRLLSRLFLAGTGHRTFLVVGAGEAAINFFRVCRDHGMTQRLRFVDLSGARADEELDGPGTPPVESVPAESLREILDDSLEAIIVAESFSALPEASVETLARAHFHHAPILTLEAFYESYWQKIPVVTIDPFWALRQDFRLARDSSYRLFKRAMDVALAALGLLASLPFLLGCTLVLRLEGAGPVFYCQKRICRDRESFTLYKFRTMTVAVEADSGLYARDHASRITPVGRWLRRLRLDELPQLWNVLRGDMSLIGPRAEWDRCVEVYERVIPCYHFRHLVKPGITGWAQVNYPYGQSVQDTVEKLKYDLYYIKNYSLLLDTSIMLKTLCVMLSFKGK